MFRETLRSSRPPVRSILAGKGQAIERQVASGKKSKTPVAHPVEKRSSIRLVSPDHVSSRRKFLREMKLNSWTFPSNYLLGVKREPAQGLVADWINESVNQTRQLPLGIGRVASTRASAFPHSKQETDSRTSDMLWRSLVQGSSI